MFGRCWLEEQLYHEWGKILECELEKDKLHYKMVIITVSDAIMKTLEERGKDIPFITNFQKISLDSTDLSNDEQTKIANSYALRDEHDISTIKDANLYLFGYPLLCSIVASRHLNQYMNILDDNDHIVSSMVYRLLEQSPDEYCRLCTSALALHRSKNDRRSITSCDQNIPRIRRLREKNRTEKMTFPSSMYTYKNVGAIFQKYALVSFSKLAPKEFIELTDVECLMNIVCVDEDMGRMDTSSFIPLPKRFTSSLVTRIAPVITADTVLRRAFIHSPLAKSEHVLTVLFRHLQDEDQFHSIIGIDEPEASLLVCYAKYCQSFFPKVLQRLEIHDINLKRLEESIKKILDILFEIGTRLQTTLLEYAYTSDTQLSRKIKSYFDNMPTNEEGYGNLKAIIPGNIIKKKEQTCPYIFIISFQLY